MQTTKICSRCKVEKEIGQFPLRKISRDGRRGTCDLCMSENATRYRQSPKGQKTRMENYVRTADQRAESSRIRHARKREGEIAKIVANLEMLTSDGEEWREITGTNGIYQVSSFGQVRRSRPGTSTMAGRLLAPSPSVDGYPLVVLTINGKGKREAVHRLVASAFLGEKPPGTEINHKDANKTNNRPENLEYITHRENMIHASLNGCFGDRRGEKGPSSVLTERDVLRIRELYEDGVIKAELSRQFKVGYTTITNVVRRVTWSHI